MTDHVPLDTIDHADLRVAVRYGAEFGDAVNQVLVFPTEFEESQREYPIVFRHDDRQGFYAVALLGLDRDENLYLAGDRWDAAYVPAVRARGPFVTGFAGPGGEPVTHIDMADPRVGDAMGEELFLRHGGHAPHLHRIERVLDAIRRGHDATAPMFAALTELQLLQPTEIEIDLGDGATCVVGDVHLIAQDRLAALPGAELERLNKGGFLRAAFMAAASVANFQRLADRRQARERPAA